MLLSFIGIFNNKACFVYKEFSLAKCVCLVKYLGKANDVLLHSILSKVLISFLFVLENCVRGVFFSAKCVTFGKYFSVGSVFVL